MRIKWGIEDGYAGKARPHYIEIDDEDLEDYKTEDEKNDFIDEMVQEDFLQKCSFYWEVIK